MPTDVRCLVETDHPIPVLRLVGDLDLDSADTVRGALLDALQAAPGALVVDVTGLTVAVPAARSVLTDVLRGAGDWAATRVVLCDPTGRWSEPGTGLVVHPDAGTALTALGDGPVGRRLSAELEPVVGAARRARELVTEACARWDLPGLVGPGCIVVTEMVNNVVAHVRGAMTVRLARRPGGLAVTVRDGSTRLPRFGGPVPPTSYGGRGLLLIDSVSRRWGSVPLDDGKIVWALLDAEDDDAVSATPAGIGQRTALDQPTAPGR